MASNISQDFVQAGRFINRRYVQIPRDQEELLNKDEAWYENLSHGPRRMVNVPPEVVKNFHKRQSANLAQRSSPVRQATSNAARPPPNPTPGEDNEESDEGTPVPGWIQTPTRRDSDQPSQRAEQTSPLRSPLLSPERAQPKRKAPPAYVGHAISSSAVQSEELELQPLEALSEEPGAPVNRPAVRAVATHSTRPRATPPSAQEQTIPSTLSGTGQSDEQQPLAKKQRRLDETTIRDKEPELREQSVISKASPKPLPMAPGRNQQSSATNTLTPLLITQAALEQSRQSSLSKAGSAWVVDRDSSSNFTPTWEGRRPAMATQREKLIQAPTSSLPLPGPQPAQAGQRRSTPNSTRQSLGPTRVSPNTRTPYEEFRAAYPDYQESANIFVNALLIVERLKRDWLLPEFLYDDFVRVFSTFYLQYISMSLVIKADQVLTAVQWYNDNVREMQYRQKVITKSNIHDMVKAHATEVHKVRNSIGASEHAVDEAAHEKLDEDLENEAEQDEQGVDAQESGEAELEEGASVLMRSPEFHIGSPGTMEVETTTAPVGSEASVMSQVEPANGEQPSYIVMASGSDIDGQSPFEEIDLGNRSKPCFSFAKVASESADQLVFDKKGKETSNLIQSGVRVDGAAGENEPGAPGAEVKHMGEDGMPRSRSRTSPEPSISSPGRELTGVTASIEDERPEDVNGLHQGARSSPGSFASQEDMQMEELYGDEDSEDDPETPIDSDQPRFSSESHRQPPEVVISEGMHRNGATPEVKATPGTGKSSAARQSARKPSTEVSTPIASETGSVSRKSLAPLLCSSRPPSRTRSTNNNGDGPVHQRPNPRPAKKAQDTFSILADSSDEEEDAFDPPAEELAVPRPWTAAYSLAAFKTQASSSDEKPNTVDAPVKMPMPLPRVAARSSPAIKPGTTSRISMAPVASTATAAASNQTEVAQRAATDHRRVVSRVSISSFSRTGKSGSPASSKVSYANVPMSKKRVNETKEERSRRLKEHFRRRMSGKTPSSTAVSNQ